MDAVPTPPESTKHSLRFRLITRSRERWPQLADLNIRHHGDLHLGQLLTVKDDIFIIDFAGEARRTITERRRKAPAARDVASLVRSIDYSATAALERALKVVVEEGRAALVDVVAQPR